jgi:hypothetical protein
MLISMMKFRLGKLGAYCTSIILVALLAVLFALHPDTTTAQTPISQGYKSSEKISLGSIVSLKSDTADQIVAASVSNVDALLGVVINSQDSSVLINNGQFNQVQIATSGTAKTLVSTINGDISAGDNITASSLIGVGMKATSNTRVIGTAQASLDSTNGTKHVYTDEDGIETTVYLGDIPVMINVAYYFKEPDKTLIPQTLQNVANSIAGKQVSALPIILSTAIFIITIIVVVSIIFSMIRNSIISVGRNPMSQSAVYRDLVQLSALVMVILSASMIAIYLILTRME